MEFSFRRFHVLAESLGRQYAAGDGPDNASAGPFHTFQKSSTVDAVLIVVVFDSAGISVGSHFSASRKFQTEIGSGLFRERHFLFWINRASSVGVVGAQ